MVDERPLEAFQGLVRQREVGRLETGRLRDDPSPSSGDNAVGSLLLRTHDEPLQERRCLPSPGPNLRPGPKASSNPDGQRCKVRRKVAPSSISLAVSSPCPALHMELTVQELRNHIYSTQKRTAMAL
jgi:hypothetical protein